MWQTQNLGTTEVNNLNTPRHGNGGSPNGSQTATICFGGTPPNKTETESWDGTNWTEVSDLNTARYEFGGIGTQTAALAFGGATPPSKQDLNELWNDLLGQKLMT